MAKIPFYNLCDAILNLRDVVEGEDLHSFIGVAALTGPLNAFGTMNAYVRKQVPPKVRFQVHKQVTTQLGRFYEVWDSGFKKEKKESQDLKK